MIDIKLGIVCLLIGLSSCAKNKSANHATSLSNQDTIHAASDFQENLPFNYMLEAGVLQFQPKDESSTKVIELLNEDKSIWGSIDFSFNKYPKDGFEPFAFHPDYFLLVFQCTGKKSHYWEVIVNETTKEKKYIDANNRSMVFEKWEKHLLGIFSIDFDLDSTLVLRNLSDQSSKIVLTEQRNGFRFEPIAVKGEWLKIKWQEYNESWNQGWVRWRNGKELLVELFYFA